MNSNQISQKLFTYLGRGAIALTAGGFILNTCIYDVEGGKRAVIFDRIKGVSNTVVGEGTHILMPWLQKPIIYDIRTKPRNISTSTGSKDMQMVSLTLRVLHKPMTNRINVIYQNLGLDYDERVLPSIGNEVLKATVAQFDASELITQREVVSSRIREQLVARAKEFYIELEDVSIEAERARYIVEKAEQERQANVIRAEGEAEAASLISQALEKVGAGLIQIRKIEAAKEIASTLSNSPNVMYLPNGANGTQGSNGGGQGTNLLLNVMK